MIGTIPVDDLIILARRAHSAECCPEKCNRELLLRCFVTSLCGLIAERFGDEPADAISNSLAMEHISAGNS